MRKEIVVGLDDSPSSELALQWAAQDAKTTDACCKLCMCTTGPTGQFRGS
jgi:nucleotide-binding universal stress UspA family protein